MQEISVISVGGGRSDNYTSVVRFSEPFSGQPETKRAAVRPSYFRFGKLSIVKLMLASSLITFDALAVYVLTKWKIASGQAFRCEMGIGLAVGVIAIGAELMRATANAGLLRHRKLEKYYKAACLAANLCVSAADVFLIFVASFCLFDATDRLRNKLGGAPFPSSGILSKSDPALVAHRKERNSLEITFASNLIILLLASGHLTCSIAAIVQDRSRKRMAEKRGAPRSIEKMRIEAEKESTRGSV